MSAPVIRTFLAGPGYIKQKPPFQRILPSKRLENALAEPTWSVRSLLPPAGDFDPKVSDPVSEEITPEKLHHLLNLSALPLPKTPAEEQSLLKTLRAQIHFVREIQQVDTTGVEPLRAIGDETAEHIEETTITLGDLRNALHQEEVVGRNGRIKRKVKLDSEGNEVPYVDAASENAHLWKCFEMSEVMKDGETPGELRSFGDYPAMLKAEVPGRRVGRYFVVKKGSKGSEKPMETTND